MKRHYSRNVRYICSALAAILILTGCGADQAVSADPISSGESSAYTDSQNTMDWSTHQLVAAQSTETGEQWYLTEYYENWVALTQQEYDYSYFYYTASPGGDLCCRANYVRLNEDGTGTDLAALDYFDMETKESLHTEIDLIEWGLPEGIALADADIAGKELIACFFRSYDGSGNPLSHCSLVWYHMEEGIQKQLDLLPALTAAGMNDASLSTERILCDQEGNCYLILADRILIVREDGELAASLESESSPITYFSKTPDGTPFFILSDKTNKVNNYRIYDFETGEMRSLGLADYQTLKYGCLDPYGCLYTLVNGNVIRWDTTAGTMEKIYDLDANSICTNLMSEKKMGFRADGSLVIMDPHTETHNIYVLSPNPPADSRTITLVSACFSPNAERAAAAIFSRKTPGVTIAYSGIGDNDDYQTYTSNLLNQIAAGDIPDMMIVYPDTMQLLYEKGILADMTDMIPGDLKEQIFDCVWNAGTIDGKLVGLTTSLYANSMLVSDEIWPEETWTLEDMLTLADTSDSDTLLGLIPLYGYRPDPTDALLLLALRNIDSALVDWDTGTCHFDSDLFRSLLEYCKNTPIPESSTDFDDPTPVRAVQSGEYLAYPCDNIFGFSSFSSRTSDFPENYHWVGLPTEGESGNFIQVSRFLVVSKDSENLDVIRQFLPFLYDEEVERKNPDSCLRRDILRKCVFIPEWDSRVQFSMGEGSYLILDSKPDGTSYVEEYIEFMDSCVPFPVRNNGITSIVLEEVPAYFSGDKDMDAVIDIIQRRVQLYLDENS